MIKIKLMAIKDFLRSIFKEFKNLKFPTKLETLFYLVTVLLLALFCAILFFLVDYFAFKIISKILAYFS